MALKSTVHKANLQITDMDRRYFKAHDITLAQHPSETEARMMVRVLAYILHAHERLQFGKGLSDDDPALFQKSLTDEYDVWIDVGQPDENRIRKACNSAKKVFVYSYGGRPADIWWNQISNALNRFGNLTVINISEKSTLGLAAICDRSMQLYCTIQDGQAWVATREKTLQIDLDVRKLAIN